MTSASLAFCLLVRAADEVTWLQSEPLEGSLETFASHLLTTPIWFHVFHHEPNAALTADIDDMCTCVTSQFVPGSADWAHLLLNVLSALAPTGADACTLMIDLVHPGAPYLVLEEDACGAPASSGAQRLRLGAPFESCIADDTPFAQQPVPWQAVVNIAALARVLGQPSPFWKMLMRTDDGWHVYAEPQR